MRVCFGLKFEWEMYFLIVPNGKSDVLDDKHNTVALYKSLLVVASENFQYGKSRICPGLNRKYRDFPGISEFSRYCYFPVPFPGKYEKTTARAYFT